MKDIYPMKFDALFHYCPVCGSANFKSNQAKSMHCSACGFVMYVNPSAAVAAFVVNQRGELLVCIRGNEPEKGKYDLPGGFIDNDETAEQAIKRELKEELGMIVETGTYLFSIPNDYLYSGWTLPTLDIFFLVTADDGFVPVAADDVSECYFMPLDQISIEKFGFKSTRKAMKEFLLNHK